jgi:hypothetical protein
MKFYSIVIKYRLYIGIGLIAVGILTNVFVGFWPAFFAYLVGAILLFGHFFFGPLRLIQDHMESGDIEGAEKVLNTIHFPNLLYKPIRSVYFTLKGNLAMMKQDFTSAETYMKKGLDLGMPMKEAEGASLLQMGMPQGGRTDPPGRQQGVARQGKPRGRLPAALLDHDD